MESNILEFEIKLNKILAKQNGDKSLEELKELEKEAKDLYKYIKGLKKYAKKTDQGNKLEIKKLFKISKSLWEYYDKKIVKLEKKRLEEMHKSEIKRKFSRCEFQKKNNTILEKNNNYKRDTLEVRNNVFDENDKLVINSIQQSILNLIKNNKDLDSYELKDIIIAYTYYILNNDIIEIKENVEKYSKYINELLVEYLYDEGQNFEEFIIMINILKYKVDHSEKETEERIILKKILKQFKDLYNIYKEEKSFKQNDSYFKIIDFWLQDEKNYLYIKELLKRKKYLCNLRVNNKHIVFYILDLYIKNYKLMLSDKNGTYINPVYLEEVYYLFTKNYTLKMTIKEKEEIDEKLKDLKNYISNTLIKQKRKNYAINKVKEMSSKNFYKRYQYEEYEEFEEEKISNMGAYVATLAKNQVKEQDSKEAFILGNDAYSIEQSNGLIHMKVYSINFHNFIAKDSFVDRYLYECELKKEKVDDYFKDRMNFKVGDKYPVFAYELVFYPSGKFKELKVSKDIITITNKYVYTQSTDETKMIGELYQKSVSKNGGIYSSFDTSKLNEHFKEILEYSFVEFLQKEKLPFIYYGYSRILEDEKEYNMNNITNILYDFDKSSAREIVEIFSTDIDNYHYSNLPIPNAIYNLNVLNPVSFLGLEMQRMLDDCYFNQRLYSTKERIHKLKLVYLYKYIKLVEQLNKKIDYVDPNIIKMSRGKIKNRIRL